MGNLGEMFGGMPGPQRSKTRSVVGAAAQVAVVVFTGVLSWHRHGPLIGVAVILVGSVALGGPSAYAWLSPRGIVRFAIRGRRARRIGGRLRAWLTAVAAEWCGHAAMSSQSVLHGAVGIVIVGAAFAVLVWGAGLIRRLPWLARRSERIRVRRASRSQELPELFNSGW